MAGLRRSVFTCRCAAVLLWAYDPQSKISKLDEALDAAAANGWTVVDMKSETWVGPAS
jgi:hypothetical protein